MSALGAVTAYRWEVEKLTVQWRARAAAVVCFLAPFGFALALRLQDTVPADTLFGRWVHDSGLAVPLVVLGFAGQWAFPLLACLAAGDLCSAEDRHGTWPTLLTRSRSRAELFTGKVLAAATHVLVVLLLAAAGSIAAGVLLLGHQPLVGLDGILLPTGRVVELTALAWLGELPPMLAFAALGLLVSLASRSGIAGVLAPALAGLGFQLLALVGLPPVVRLLLPGTPFESWHGLMRAHARFGPLLAGWAVSAVYCALLLDLGYRLIRRRSFATS